MWIQWPLAARSFVTGGMLQGADRGMELPCRILLGNTPQIGGCERKGKTGCPLGGPSLAEMARASGSHLDLSLDLGRPGVAGSWVRSCLQLRQSLKRPTAEGAGAEALPAAAA